MVRGEGHGAHELHELFNKKIIDAIKETEKVIKSLPKCKKPSSRSQCLPKVPSQTDPDSKLSGKILPDEYSYNSPTRPESPWMSPASRQEKQTNPRNHGRKHRPSSVPSEKSSIQRYGTDDKLIPRDRVVRCDEKTFLLRELLPSKQSNRLTPQEIERLLKNKNKIGQSQCPCPYKFNAKTKTASERSSSDCVSNDSGDDIPIKILCRSNGSSKPRKARKKVKSVNSGISDISTVSGEVSLSRTKDDGVQIKLPIIKIPETFDGNFRFTVDMILKEKGKKSTNVSNVFEMEDRKIQRVLVNGEEFVRKK